jgi:hypothetical protein
MKRITILLLALATALVALEAPATSPNKLAAWLYATAEKLPHSAAPGEEREQYKQRLDGMTTSLAVATKPYADGRAWTASELSLAMLMLWHGETLFDQRIHAGVEHPKWTQDAGKARCLGQIHISQLVPEEEWNRLVGTSEGATQLCADATARIWVAMARQCGVWSGQRAERTKVAKVFAAYATGGNCTPGERDWARADKWNAAIALRPDRGPVKGYRRAMPSEFSPEAVSLVAGLNAVSSEFKIGTKEKTSDGRFLALVENHAQGKIGVSVFVKE